MDKQRIKTELVTFLKKRDLNEPYTRCCIISGGWGTGKSYLINEVIKENKNDYNFVNVSLFGINNVLELKSKIINEISRQFGKKIAFFKKILNATSINIGVGQYGSISIDCSKISDAFSERTFKNNKRDFVIVLDDIERRDYKLTISEVLGTVDELLKNKKFKVVLITNFEKMQFEEKCLEFKDFKEKIAGRTFELNDNNAITKQLMGIHYFDFQYSKNLRTVVTFSELIKSINNIKQDYPLILKKIIFNVLRLQKERIDLEKFLIDYNLRFASLYGDDGEKYIRNKYENEALKEQLIEFCLLDIELSDGFKTYNKKDVENCILSIYECIYDGDYEKLFTIDEPKYSIYHDTYKEIKAQKLDLTKNEDMLEAIKIHKIALSENSCEFRDTCINLCLFLNEYYSIFSSNPNMKKEFDYLVDQFLDITLEKSIGDSSRLYMSLEGLKRGDIVETYWGKKLTNDLNREVLRFLISLKFGEKTFEDSLIIFEVFTLNNVGLNDSFFSHFQNNNNRHLVEGLHFIYKKCSGNIDHHYQQLFSRFFKVLSKMGLASLIKNEYKTNLKGKNETADMRFNEYLISLNQS